LPRAVFFGAAVLRGLAAALAGVFTFVGGFAGAFAFAVVVGFRFAAAGFADLTAAAGFADLTAAGGFAALAAGSGFSALGSGSAFVSALVSSCAGATSIVLDSVR
jgi:hypothetical protein